MTSIPCFIFYLPLKYRYLEFSTFTQCTRAPVYAILDQIQTQSHSSEGALSSLESSLEDRDKQINQLREQRDRAEKDSKEEKELHERELAEYKMKIHTYESEVSPVVWPRPLSPHFLWLLAETLFLSFIPIVASSYRSNTPWNIQIATLAVLCINNMFMCLPRVFLSKTFYCFLRRLFFLP